MKLQILIFLAIAVYSCEGYGGISYGAVGSPVFSLFHPIQNLFCGGVIIGFVKTWLSFGNPLIKLILDTVLRKVQSLFCPTLPPAHPLIANVQYGY